MLQIQDEPSAKTEIFDNRRLGRFLVNIKMLLRDSDEAQALMSKMVIIRCEALHHRDGFEYIAYSPLFESVPYPCEPPLYDITITKSGEDIIFGISAE